MKLVATALVAAVIVAACARQDMKNVEHGYKTDCTSDSYGIRAGVENSVKYREEIHQSIEKCMATSLQAGMDYRQTDKVIKACQSISYHKYNAVSRNMIPIDDIAIYDMMVFSVEACGVSKK